MEAPFAKALKPRLVGLALAFLPWSASAHSQTTCPPTPTIQQVRAAATGHDHGLLWRLRKNGRMSWLYGTIHVARIEWATPGPQVISAVRGSDVVALELDLGDPQASGPAAPTTQAPDAGRAAPTALLARLHAEADRACVPGAFLDGREPMLQLVVTLAMGARREGFHPELAIDAVVAGMAKVLRKRTVALESPHDQLQVLRPPAAERDTELAEGLALLESGAAWGELRRIGDAWAKGDEDALREQPRTAFMARLLDARNPRMAERIADLHDAGDRVFAAVGVLHMLGPAGLVELLRARGFEVERVRFSSRE